MVVGKEKAKDYFYQLLTDKNEYEYTCKIMASFNYKWSNQIWKYSSIFVYENIFSSDDTELKNLHDYLNIPYLPLDRSKIAIKGDYRDKLTDKDIRFAKEKLRQEYAHFHRTEKVLPDQWEYSSEWNLDSLKYMNIQSNYNDKPYEYLL
jgi:hypothetical protein